MKAIHNTSRFNSSIVKTVFNTTNIQNESNSQLDTPEHLILDDCIQYYKYTKWKQFTTGYCCITSVVVLYSILQIYKMKAIHNGKLGGSLAGLTVFNTTNIQNESNSQRIIKTIYKIRNCIQYYKYTKWKQFTTKRTVVHHLGNCIQYYKYTKWKQFTTYLICNIINKRLYSILQIYKMKAIHNWDFRPY